ncbi:hypothetical protein G6L37_35210 [Agrobacterium rubi]|nr:hypothetical protein [Agrobacterium rubi]NTF23820.1 hypothetical protein [Agrobacterium rubi]
MTQFTPELGQLAFGQPFKSHAVPDIMHAALSMIDDELTRIMENHLQKDYFSPFQNSGSDYRNDVFHAEAYSWGDEEQPYNFAWKDLRISWYKRMGRGMSSNVEITPDMAAECLRDCLASLEKLEAEHERLERERDDAEA